jgi:hypothetical protein
MKFTPKSEREIVEDGLLQPGTYDFEVAGAEERVSRANNDMIVLKLHVYDDKGVRHFVTDYLLESIAYKLRNAAVALGLQEDYEKGHLRAANFVGRPGRVKIGIKKDPTGQYPDQNNVRDYVRPDANGSDGAEPARRAPPIVDDKIPW